MKKLLIILLGVAIINNTFAQNTLDKLGLSAGTPAATAYSLRLLSSNYTGAAIQVRRSNDDATQDIGFTASGDFDTTALFAFAGSYNAFVGIWYDQSGNGRNMIKTDFNYQPQIVFNGALKHIGSMPAIDFSGNKGMVYSGSLNLYSIITVLKSESVNWPSYHTIMDGSPRFGGILENGGTTFHSNVFPLAIWRDGVAKTTAESLAPVNEGMVLSISPQTHNVYQVFMGNYDGGGGGGSILEAEAIAFSSLISTGNRTNVECSQGTYYAIATSCSTLISAEPSPAPRAECMGSVAQPITVEASGLNLTYQWYSNTLSANSGGTLISGATGSSFIPSTSSPGTTYYYVEVSGSVGPAKTSQVSGGITVDLSPIVSISPADTTIHEGATVSMLASGANAYMWGNDNATPLNHTATYKFAVGLRLLRTGYSGNALRLRRNSDNAEADFGFTGSDLDMASINTFLGASAGYCTIMYDQSGFNNDLIQTNNTQQPLFVAAGLNGKPVLHFNNGQSLNNSANYPAPYTVVYAAKQTGPSRGRVLSSRFNNWLLGWWNGSMAQAYFEGWVSPGGGTSSDNNPYVYTGTSSGGSSSLYQNSVLLYQNNGGVSGPNGITLNGSESSDADIAEVFIFNTVLPDPEREAVEESSGSYYGIFGATPIPGAVLNISPLSTTTYYVTGTSVNGGCNITASSTVTVLHNPDLRNFSSQTRIYFDGSFNISKPLSNSAAAFTYSSSNPAVAIVSGASIQIVGFGVTNITAIQAGNTDYYSDSITAVLTITGVDVVTKNGQVTNTIKTYVDGNGAQGRQKGLSAYGQIKSAMSSGDGLTAANPGSSAYQIKQDYPGSADGLYWIANSSINSGVPFQIYADMTTDGGGWTLLLCNTSPNPGWDNSNALLRNENSPSVNATYSIIGWADYIKRSSSGFQYMLDAQTRRSNGGIWTANENYSFVSTSNAKTNITLDIKFGSWNYSDGDIEERMPWYAPGSQGLITTSIDANGNWWGSLIASGGWSPAPWLGNSVQHPGVIWYWVR